MDPKKKKSKNTNISDFFHPSSSASGQSSAQKNQEKEPEYFASKEASKTKLE